MITPKSEAEKRAETLKKKIDALQFSKIPGYFPTPPSVIDLMLDHARIEAGHSVLEPSAGSGAIVDICPEPAKVVCYEKNASLREILDLKGYRVEGSDFFDSDPVRRFDRIVMNPPFEKQQDLDHVEVAYLRLKPGGRLVAIMSASVEFRDNGKTKAFRQLIDDNGGEIHKLEPGAFKESGTGVNAVLVVIDKP